MRNKSLCQDMFNGVDILATGTTLGSRHMAEGFWSDRSGVVEIFAAGMFFRPMKHLHRKVVRPDKIYAVGSLTEVMRFSLGTDQRTPFHREDKDDEISQD